MPGHPVEPRTISSSWLSRLSVTGRALLDLVYPPHCTACGRQGTLFCPECQAQVETLHPVPCPRCGWQIPAGGFCTRCRRASSPLNGIIATASFAPPLRPAIHAFKYANGRALAEPLAARLAASWQEHGVAAAMVVPVPLHVRRERERGYNQAVLLARLFAASTGMPLADDILIRQKDTLPQVDLNWAERRENMQDAFACRRPVTGQRIVLIDDVCTTGATLEACAAALCTGGAVAVWGLTVARARWQADPGAKTIDF